MRKSVFFVISLFLIIFCITPLVAQEIENTEDQLITENQRVSLSGIWENDNRYVVFDDDSGDNSMTQVLKLFYGWYLDTASQNKTPEVTYRNNSTSTRGPTISSSTTKTSDITYTISVNYPRSGQIEVPVVQIDECLYTDFYIKGSAFSEEVTEDYWRPASNIPEILLYKPEVQSEVYGWIITDDYTYKIRYWLTDAPYTETLAILKDGENTYNIDKYVSIGGSVYTCVHGLKTEVRNMKKTTEPITIKSSTENVFAIGKPYLTRCANDESLSVTEKLSSIIKEQNSKQKPPRKPDIEYLDLDFHYDEIEKILNKKG